MEVRAFLALVIPFIIVFYLAVLLIIHPPRQVLVASLLGGLSMTVINILVDIGAYYAGWWHYTINDLILHVPLPMYLSVLIFYGSIVFLTIWQFWQSRRHWFALFLFFGTPIFCILRDYFFGFTGRGYSTWDNSSIAAIATLVMWPLAFYTGYYVFKRLAPARATFAEQEEQSTGVQAR